MPVAQAALDPASQKALLAEYFALYDDEHGGWGTMHKFMDADSIAYLSLDGLTGAVSGGRSRYCTSCYTGVYPVAFPRDEAAYLQLALKLNPEPEPLEHVDIVFPSLEKDSVAS